jgi:prepilin-type N-terminal cleavage/methylation domain-containing protein
MSKTQKKNGFTLIELLVVIAIITLLSSIVFASVKSARMKARNARRTADIGQLVVAFNLGLSDSNGVLPASGGDVCISATCYGGWTGVPVNATVDNFLSPYIQKPSDPQDSSRIAGGYLYNSSWSGVSPYDGWVFSGAYLAWLMELPVNTTICGPGRIWSVSASAVECVFKLD